MVFLIFIVSRNLGKDITYDEAWQIMRGGPEIEGAVRVRALAPGDVLFKQYHEQWKGTDPAMWWHLYEKQFIRELNQKMFHKLVSLVKAGKTIVLFCFCKDARYCHRSILARILKEQGVKVEVYEPPGEGVPETGPKQLTLDDFFQR